MNEVNGRAYKLQHGEQKLRLKECLQLEACSKLYKVGICKD